MCRIITVIPSFPVDLSIKCYNLNLWLIQWINNYLSSLFVRYFFLFGELLSLTIPITISISNTDLLRLHNFPILCFVPSDCNFGNLSVFSLPNQRILLNIYSFSQSINSFAISPFFILSNSAAYTQWWFYELS
jgi:hypothetical protein